MMEDDALLLEQVFALLEEATRLEKTGRHRIEAATKYYESCYLMRQIVATAEAKHDHRDKPCTTSTSTSTTSTTIGSSSRRLLQEKIDHYTALARRLYFNQPESEQQTATTTTTTSKTRTASTSTKRSTSVPHEGTQSSGQRTQQQQQPTTTVMIGLLDDAISVLTENNNNTLPSPIPVPVVGIHTKPSFTSQRQQQQEQQHQRPHPTAPIMPQQEYQYCKRNKGNNNHHERPYSNDFKKPLRQQHQQRNSKRPLNDLAAIDRRIHLQANIGHCLLSKAIDLDENRGIDPNTQQRVVESYVEASEAYLSAIQLSNQQQRKLEAAAAAAAAASRHRSESLVYTVLICLQTKLKRLLGSALDRVEALKEEQQMSKLYGRDFFKACASSSSSFLGLRGGPSTTTAASNRSSNSPFRVNEKQQQNRIHHHHQHRKHITCPSTSTTVTRAPRGNDQKAPLLATLPTRRPQIHCRKSPTTVLW